VRGGTSHGRLLRAADPLPNSLRPGGAPARTPRFARQTRARASSPPGPRGFERVPVRAQGRLARRTAPPAAGELRRSKGSRLRQQSPRSQGELVQGAHRPLLCRGSERVGGVSRERRPSTRGVPHGSASRPPDQASARVRRAVRGVCARPGGPRSGADAGRGSGGGAVGHPSHPRLVGHGEMAWCGSRSPRSPWSPRSLWSPLRSGPRNATAPEDPGPWSATRGALTEEPVTSRERPPGPRLPGPCREEP
jgi:hypothetical protein